MRDDRGTISAFVAGVALSLLLAGGLVLDGGRLVDARLQVADAAAGAARAGAQAASGLRGGPRSSIPRGVGRRGSSFLAGSGLEGSVVVSAGTVTVTAPAHRHMALLGLAGAGDRTVSATRSARPVAGP